MGPILAMVLVGAMVEVRPAEAEGVGTRALEDAITLVLESLQTRGTPACWNGDGQAELMLAAASRCTDQEITDVLHVGLFGGISKVRWLLTRRSPAGRELGQVQVDLPKGAPAKARVVAALDKLLPSFQSEQTFPPVPAVTPLPPDPPATWPPVVGLAGLVVGAVGVVFLGSAFSAQGSIDRAGIDPVELESIENRRITHSAVGGILISAAIGAVIVYAAGSD